MLRFCLGAMLWLSAMQAAFAADDLADKALDLASPVVEIRHKAAAFFVARGNISTLTREMFLSIREQIEPTIAAISSVLISTTVLLAAIAYSIQSRQEET